MSHLVICPFCGTKYESISPCGCRDIAYAKAVAAIEAEAARAHLTTDGDALDTLCLTLYGRYARARDYIGGSNAQMLRDATEEIKNLRAELRELQIGTRRKPTV